MDKNEIRDILSQNLDKEFIQLDPITEADWNRLENFVQTQFPESYRWFSELMAEFAFPGDILNIQECGNTNGNDPVSLVFESEFRDSEYPWLVPFYSIGNGDYFCFDAREKKNSAVYYFHHEDRHLSCENPSFDDWLRALPKFLNGE
jgi:hypothetical protein